MLRTGNDVNAIIPLTMASADSSVAPYPVTTTASAPVRSSPTTHGEKLTRAPPFFDRGEDLPGERIEDHGDDDFALRVVPYERTSGWS